MLEKVLHADEAALLWIRARRKPLLVQLMRSFTKMGDGSTWFMVGLFSWAAGRTDCMLHLVFAVSLGSGLAAVLKRVCRRPRPNAAIEGFEALAKNPDQFSFPSGHTATAVAVAFSMAGLGSGMALAAGLVAACVSCSRIYLGAHYPLDVVAGAFIGMVAGVSANLALPV
ncbi:MAG: phosphatase PAP2 family protein [Myxococcota bacterium]